MIIRLAHVEVGVQDLDRAQEFYVDVLGFKLVQRTGDALYLRAMHEFDLWSLKLTLAGGAGMISAGLRVDSPDDLQALASLHERLGLRHAALPAEFEPGRGEGLRVATPAGHVIDFHHTIDELEPPSGARGPVPPMRHLEASRGVPPTELDHINMRVSNFKESLDYWTGDLGFVVAELLLGDDDEPVAAWTRRTRTTHDVAFGSYPGAGLHHFAYSVADGSSMLRTCDLLGDAGYAHHLQFGPSRHGATNALTMYFLDPDGNRIELFCGDYHRDLDRPANVWTREAFDRGGRFWWGVEAKPEFQVPTPLLDARWPTPVGVTG